MLHEGSSGRFYCASWEQSFISEHDLNHKTSKGGGDAHRASLVSVLLRLGRIASCNRALAPLRRRPHPPSSFLSLMRAVGI